MKSIIGKIIDSLARVDINSVLEREGLWMNSISIRSASGQLMVMVVTIECGFIGHYGLCEVMFGFDITEPDAGFDERMIGRLQFSAKQQVRESRGEKHNAGVR